MSTPSGAPARVNPSKKGISAVWIIPIVAGLIGAWLIFTAISERGPSITIEFETGTGIVAGKTEVKYRGIVVGRVTNVDIKQDLTGVIIDVQMEGEADFVLTDKTRFWIVKPRIAAGEVSGLSTLLSGAYIGIDPVPDGEKQRNFIGLERPPSVLTGEPGTAFQLTSPTLGSLSYGSPIYYHGLNVGRVTNYKMQDDGEIVFDIYVQAPHDRKIVSDTRFWNAGGVDLELRADGIRLQTASIATLLAGGISFDTTKTIDDTVPVDAGHTFRLFDSERASKSGEFRIKEYYILNFDGSVRGLEAGAPVEFRGIRIGTVEQIIIKPAPDRETVQIPVLIAIEPERYGRETASNPNDSVANLVRQGLRASLETGNLLTGAKYVDIEFYPDAEPAELLTSGTYPEIPTVGDDVEEVVDDAQALINELRITASRINDLLETPENGEREGDLAATLSSIRDVTNQINSDIAPNLNATLMQAEKTLANAQSMLAEDATTRTELNRLLVELTQTAKSIREAADYLEQHPESIVFGKDE